MAVRLSKLPEDCLVPPSHRVDKPALSAWAPANQATCLMFAQLHGRKAALGELCIDIWTGYLAG